MNNNRCNQSCNSCGYDSYGLNNKGCCYPTDCCDKTCYLIGPTGPQGVQGLQGIQGVPGATGAQGPQGPQGPQGIQGPTGPQGIQGLIGPQGPAGATGPQGPAGVQGAQGIAGTEHTITIGRVTTVEADQEARVIDVTGAPNHVLDFEIPRGYDGGDGYDGQMGPQGPAGISETITIGRTTTVEPEAAATVSDIGGAPNHLLTFSIPRGATGAQGVPGPAGPQGIQGVPGPQGPVGATGPERISTVYIATLNTNFTDEGVEVPANSRLPLARKEVDMDNICVLNPADNTLQFNREGNYKIDFVVNANIDLNGAQFDDVTDLISVGFRRSGNTVVFAGSTLWSDSDFPSQLVAHGMFVVTDVSEPFELFNFSKRSIFLNTPDLVNTDSTSYFVNPLVTIVIQYLG